ncbi:hypothetical protein PVAG01_00401 [Phlyctema vagabunda]|uniref:CsbD-like domain-containing protein n=1 Tax=Phlyctema vagabunda TaxID=108571 RepID=A0ABR4PUR1_9HELO
MTTPHHTATTAEQTTTVPQTTHTTTTTTTTQPTTGEKVKQGATGVKGAIAAVHGVGETMRGKFNSKVDQQFNEPTGVAKNEAIAAQGEQELDTGKFSHGTKAREGVEPSVGQTRF